MQNWIKKIEIKKLIKWGCITAGCILAAFLVELFYFNYHPLFDKTERVEFTLENGTAVGCEEAVEVDQSDVEHPKFTIYLGEKKYYGKLSMKFTEYGSQKYKVSWNTVNDLGKEETVTVKDVKMSGYRAGVTNIYEKIDSLTVELYGKHRSDVVSVVLKNELQLNRYRLVLLFSIFFLLLFMIIKREWFQNRIHLVFLVMGFFISLNFWFIEDIMQSGWDENVHFVESYGAALGEETIYSRAIAKLEDLPGEIRANTYDEHRMMIGYFNRAHKDVYGVGKIREFTYRDILYLPYIILIKLFSFLGASFYEMYFLTKMGGILAYLLVMTYAIKKAKTGKLFLAATGIMPTRLFINSTYNYDSITVAFLMLGFVLWLNELLEPEKKLTIKKALAIVLCFGLGSLVKQVYIGFVLLLLLFPDSKFKSRRQKWTIFGGFFLVGAAILTVMVAPMLLNYMQGISQAGDYRVGDANITGQLAVVLAHPFAYLKLLCREVKETLGEFLLGRFAYVNFSFHRRPETRFGYITAVIMLVLFFLRIEDKDQKEVLLAKKYKAGILAVILITTALIWSSMYLAYTPVGEDVIKGVQARYYAPLIYPLMLILKNKYVTIQVEERKWNWIMMGLVMLVNFYCIYNICFVTWSA